jgi:hypothetical protein
MSVDQALLPSDPAVWGVPARGGSSFTEVAFRGMQLPGEMGANSSTWPFAPVWGQMISMEYTEIIQSCVFSTSMGLQHGFFSYV